MAGLPNIRDGIDELIDKCAGNLSVSGSGSKNEEYSCAACAHKGIHFEKGSACCWGCRRLMLHYGCHMSYLSERWAKWPSPMWSKLREKCGPPYMSHVACTKKKELKHLTFKLTLHYLEDFV